MITMDATRTGTRRRRTLLAALLLMLTQLVAVAWPAHACGCGGMVPSDETTVSVDRETSVVRWDGTTQQIVMSLTVSGDAPEAAWIMPVPTRATVELGDRALFSDLSRVTRPERRERHYFWPRSGDWPFSSSAGDGAKGGVDAGAPPVGVVGRERLGPFDVARLTATDPDALEDWLADNGFELPERMATELRPYVEREWEYVAIRLAPASRDGGEDAVLGGTLDPLHLTFASDELVYPMRLSRAARTPQALRLYVLAPHRMEPGSAIGGDDPEVTFAGRLTAADQPDGPVRELAGGEVFLTALEQDFPRPERITGDHRLTRAGSDAEHRQVAYRDRLLTVGGFPVWALTVLAVLAAAVAAVVLRVRYVRRRAFEEYLARSPVGYVSGTRPPGH